MTNQDRAKAFMEFWKVQDPRCQQLLTILFFVCGVQPDESLKLIQEMADGR